MQFEVLQTIGYWAITALVYPGLLFAVLLALVGEWLTGALRPSFTPRTYRAQSRPPPLLQPLYDFLKLAGRYRPANPGIELGDYPGAVPPTGLAVVGAVAPVLALALLPFPGSPVTGSLGGVGDILTLLALLAVQPVCRAALRMSEGGQATLKGAQDLGRLVTGLFPALIAVAALLEVARSGSLKLASLTGAPETAQQTLVRLLAAAALLIALPWWLESRYSGTGQESAGALAGRLFERAALAAFWAVMVLPAAGDLAWAVVLYVAGALFAYVGMHILAERWAPAAREKDMANLTWATALPVAALALVVAVFLSGA